MRLNIQLFGGRGAGSMSAKGKDSDLYVYKDSYESYSRKQYELSGSDFKDQDNLVYGTNEWTGKEYTNDEFIEHLIDSNFHAEVRVLGESNLTNKQLAYIKDNTTLSQWGVGDYKGKIPFLRGGNIEKIVKDARKNAK